LIQLQSNDAGVSWPSDKAIVPFRAQHQRIYLSGPEDSTMYEDPDVLPDTTAFRSDTVPTPGGSLDVLIDNDGTIHGVFPLYASYTRRYQVGSADSAAPGGIIYQAGFNYTDVGLVYYRETSDGTFFRTVLEQPGGVDNSGQFLDDRSYASGFSRWPQLGFGADGNIYLAFGSGKSGDIINAQSQLETEAKNYYYSHIYAMYTNNGRDWSTPVDLTPEGIDAQFPSVSNLVNDKLMIAYQADTYPGDWLSSSGTNTTTGAATGSGLHDQLRDVVEVMSIDKAALGSINAAGVSDHTTTDRTTATASISSVAPNPTTGSTTISYNVGQTGEYTIAIFNTLGQKVATPLNHANRLAGSYTLGIDQISHLVRDGRSVPMYVMRKPHLIFGVLQVDRT
jgi:hypothetical protein